MVLRLFSVLVLLLSFSLWGNGNSAALTARLKRLGNKPTPAQLAEVVSRCVADADYDQVAATVSAILKRQLDAAPLRQLGSERRKALTALADTWWLLRLNRPAARRLRALQDDAFRSWLFGSARRSGDLLDHLALRFAEQPALLDDYPRVLDALHRLFLHAGADRLARFWDVALALALVFDCAERPPLHPQMGPQRPDATPDLGRRFDYFVTVLTSKEAPYRRGELSIPELTFVVDTPLPVSELEWAREHVRMTAPERLFHSIRYDQGRVARGVFDWPHGPYFLSLIRKLGGICTDQAYFTVMALRAHGYPAILFVGQGRRGGHAWVAYRQPRKGWVTNIGRFKEDRFTTGHALHPQTAEPFNDHLLPLICDSSPEAQRAEGLARLAALLVMSGHARAARLIAEQATAIRPPCLLAWEVRLSLTDNVSELIKLLERQAVAFKDYPDLVQEFRLQQADMLRRKGQSQAANRILQKQTERAGKRDDLAADATLAHINAALQEGKHQQARKLFEEFLKDYKEEAAKLHGYVLLYLEMTRQTQQTAEALRFMKTFVRSAKRHFERLAGSDPRFKNWDDLLLIQALENHGDTKQAEKLRRKLN